MPSLSTQPPLASPDRGRAFVLAVLVLLVVSIPVGLCVRLMQAWMPAHHHDVGVSEVAHVPHGDVVLERLAPRAHSHADSERHHHDPGKADVHLDADAIDADLAATTLPDRKLYTLLTAALPRLTQRAGADPPAPLRWLAPDGRAPDGLERPPRGLTHDAFLRAG